jgi:hypothetical protein
LAKAKNPSITPRFEPGAKVRVKRGVTDPDFPDIPLGGWAGSIKEVQGVKGEPTYLIEWDGRTLKGIHPAYRKRCERDGLEFETMWLGDEDIEPDEGKPVPIERPTAIVTPPLSEEDQDDRVRMALGLTHDDPLPDVSRKTLLAYHRHLTAHLKLPFKARHEGDGSSLTVHRLPGPRQYDLDEEEGLLCEARDREGPFDVPLAELDEAGSGNRRLVGDYGYWFGNYR